jgi:CRISPR-associated protein Csc3
MTEKTSDTIDELARLAFDVARPTSFKPHAVERVFRESVKAITKVGTTQPSRQDCKHYVSGRIQKLIDRSEQIYPISEEKSMEGGNFGERVDRYADFFVDRLLSTSVTGNQADSSDCRTALPTGSTPRRSG